MAVLTIGMSLISLAAACAAGVAMAQIRFGFESLKWETMVFRLDWSPCAFCCSTTILSGP